MRIIDDQSWSRCMHAYYLAISKKSLGLLSLTCDKVFLDYQHEVWIPGDIYIRIWPTWLCRPTHDVTLSVRQGDFVSSSEAQAEEIPESPGDDGPPPIDGRDEDSQKEGTRLMIWNPKTSHFDRWRLHSHIWECRRHKSKRNTLVSILISLVPFLFTIFIPSINRKRSVIPRRFWNFFGLGHTGVNKISSPRRQLYTMANRPPAWRGRSFI